MFSPNAGTPNRDLSDDALKSLSALSYLCDESNELSSVSQTFISGGEKLETLNVLLLFHRTS